jgi:5-methylcytosine-specific restriction endonuclease McrA
LIHSASRVAPEKAVFRPALSRSFTAGLSPERDMAKDNRTYWEKLRDPKWQRLRTERMTIADFTCENCEADDRTLNVHHRIYRKGKEPWEYALADLICLCEVCHEVEHGWRDQLKEVMAKLDVMDIERLCGYAKGLQVIHAWDAEDIRKVPPVRLAGAEECTGMTDALGLWAGDPEYSEVFTSEVPVTHLMRFMTEASARRRQNYERLKALGEDE